MTRNPCSKQTDFETMPFPGFLSDIVKRLQDRGHSAFIVGGAIRDFYLQRKVMDWDVATSASKQEIRQLFIDTSHFSLKHDTVTLMDKGIGYEVTPFRGEGERRDIGTDLGLRDFTIDAMAYEPESKILLDPHEGREDCKKKIIRAVRNPKKRFKEDPLRLIRAVRLAAEVGFVIETETMKAISCLSDHLNDVSHERIRDELVKILLSPSPSWGIRLMHKTGLLKVILPELLEGYRKQQNRHHRFTIFRHILETIDATEPEELLRLTALLHDIAKPRVRKKDRGVWRFIGHEKESTDLALEIMGRLRFSNERIRDVSLLIQNHMLDYDSSWTDGAVRRLIRRVGPELIYPLISFRKADLIAHGRRDNRHEMLRELEARVEAELQTKIAGVNRTLAINGHQVMEILDIDPGPELGQVLQELLERVTDQPGLNNEKDLTRILRKKKRSKRRNHRKDENDER